MIQNISHTARKPSVREDENMIRVCYMPRQDLPGMMKSLKSSYKSRK